MSSIASAVDKATSELLLVADWDSILFLCDHASGAPEIASNICSLLKQRLAKSKNPKVQDLVLILLDALVKNAHNSVVPAVEATGLLGNASKAPATGAPATLVELCDPAQQEEVRTKAADLVQLLGMSQGGVFAEVYSSLQRRGVKFPPPNTADIASITPRVRAPSVGHHEPPAPTRERVSSVGGRAHNLHGQHPHRPAEETVDPAARAAQMQSAIDKLNKELGTVRSKVALVARFLVNGDAASPRNPEFLDCVDFLEQCTPRLTALIEAGISGQLHDESVLDSCLSVNEGVARVLDIASRIADHFDAPDAFIPAPHPEVADLVDFDSVLDIAAPSTAPVSSGGAHQPAAAVAHDALLDLFQAPAPAPSSTAHATSSQQSVPPSRAAQTGVVASSSSAMVPPSPMTPAPNTAIASATPLQQPVLHASSSFDPFGTDNSGTSNAATTTTTSSAPFDAFSTGNAVTAPSSTTSTGTAATQPHQQPQQQTQQRSLLDEMDDLLRA